MCSSLCTPFHARETPSTRHRESSENVPRRLGSWGPPCNIRATLPVSCKGYTSLKYRLKQLKWNSYTCYPDHERFVGIIVLPSTGNFLLVECYYIPKEPPAVCAPCYTMFHFIEWNIVSILTHLCRLHMFDKIELNQVRLSINSTPTCASETFDSRFNMFVFFLVWQFILLDEVILTWQAGSGLCSWRL
jgi:hypothetical protein